MLITKRNAVVFANCHNNLATGGRKELFLLPCELLSLADVGPGNVNTFCFLWAKLNLNF